MKLENLPLGFVIGGLAVAVVLAVWLCVLVMTRTSSERRTSYARLLGKAFIVLIAATMLLGAVQQWGR